MAVRHGRSRPAGRRFRLLPVVFGLALAALLPGCASREMVLEVQGSVLYDKPAIVSVSHSLEDGRRDGGTVIVKVRMRADPGLAGSFDITPGVVERHHLRETSAGDYEGEFALPADFLGGPYTIIGRARHERAGEVTAKDPVPMTISLPR